jgi:hypothetical protein
MRLRAHRRNLVGWSPPAGQAGRYGAPRLAPTRRFRRFIRIGALVTTLGLIRLARGVRPRWRPLLAGVVLTVAGFMLRGSLWGIMIIGGFWFLVYALLMPVTTGADRERRAELEHDLAAYSTPIQRRDLEATLDEYADNVTSELRDILAGQGVAAGNNGLPGAGRY